ncbi:conserved hypothetical protein [Ricinus communis]|uniref:Late embryogenesis abundant protein LEA-2 subgroup domain-containing protein n=1 Tax=Ricinus communis TaxID=3988 RepID=B9RMJ7_RICCO|nr:conserved hypothetical protein [Ricinus communis]
MEPTTHPLLTRYSGDDENGRVNTVWDEPLNCCRLMCRDAWPENVICVVAMLIISLAGVAWLYMGFDTKIYGPKFQVDSVVLFSLPHLFFFSYVSQLECRFFTIRNEQNLATLLYCEHMEASVYFHDKSIPSTAFFASKFFLEPNTNTLMHVNFAAASSVPLNQTLAEAMINERAALGALSFTFKMNASLVENPVEKAQHTRNICGFVYDLNILFIN